VFCGGGFVVLFESCWEVEFYLTNLASISLSFQFRFGMPINTAPGISGYHLANNDNSISRK
jgi:hypothetical protein